MRVVVDEREYVLYVEHTSNDRLTQRWAMHTYSLLTGDWLVSSHDVSNVNPFASSVDYDAWR